MRRVNKEGKELKIVCIFILLSIYKNVKIFTISYITTFNAEKLYRDLCKGENTN